MESPVESPVESEGREGASDISVAVDRFIELNFLMMVMFNIYCHFYQCFMIVFCILASSNFVTYLTTWIFLHCNQTKLKEVLTNFGDITALP